MKQRSKAIVKVTSLLMVLSTVFVLAFGNFAVRADEAQKADKVSDVFSNDANAAGKDIFGGTTKVAKEAGNSAKTLVMTVAIIILVIGAIIVGLQFTNKNATKRAEAKGNLVALIIGAVIVFAAVAIIAFSGNIADSLSSSLGTDTTNNSGSGSGE